MEHLIRRAELDLAFHDEIYRLSGHRQLQEAWGNLRARVRVLLVATGVLREPDASANGSGPYARWHTPVVAALRDRDPDLAEAAVIRHLAKGERDLVARLGGDVTTLRVESEALARRPDFAVHLGHMSTAVRAVEGRTT